MRYFLYWIYRTKGILSMKTFPIVLIVATLISCNSSQKEKMDSVENDVPVVLSKKQLSDSILMARHGHVQTDILSKNLPDLKKSDAYDIQLEMMEKEIDAGAKLIGWKLGVQLPKMQQNLIRLTATF